MTDDGLHPRFSRPNGPELWVLLLEKAFAKLWGAYGYLEGGHVILALQSFTGNHGVLMDVQKYCQSTSNDQFFDVIHGTLSHGFVMDVRPPNMLVRTRSRNHGRGDGVFMRRRRRDAVESFATASVPRRWAAPSPRPSRG